MNLSWQPKYNPKEWHFLDMFGPAGYRFINRTTKLRVIISVGKFKIGQKLKLEELLTDPTLRESGNEWIHISLSRKDRMPDWKDLVTARQGFLEPTAYAYLVFPPEDKYVNIHKTCLHIYSRLDGLPELPDFHMEIVSGINSI
jgi:hypothetical protein